MIDLKGDCSKLFYEQVDQDLFMCVICRNQVGLFVSGVKVYMIGGLNFYWMMVLFIMCLSEGDKDFVVIGVVFLQVEGLIYIYGC